MFSGLRLIDGICLDAFVTRFGKSASELYPQISGWVSEGLMETDGNRLRLTPAAFWLLTPYSCISSSQAAEKTHMLRCAQSPRSNVLAKYASARRFFARLASEIFLSSLQQTFLETSSSHLNDYSSIQRRQV